MAAGKEEYLNSEKYEFFQWDWTIRNKITALITRINHIRKENESLQQTNNIVFCETNNDNVMAYYKYDDELKNKTLMVVSLDGSNNQNAMVRIPIEELGQNPLNIYDQITGNSYQWSQLWNYVELMPEMPFHLFKIQ
jgi:starch synthase (maltosyl-transferring)